MGATRARKFLVTALSLNQLLLFSFMPAFASTVVKVAGQQAFIVPVGAGSITASQRGDTIQRNLDNALVAVNGGSPASVGVSYVNKQPVITLGGFYVTSVDVASAKQAGITQAALAERWAAGLKKVLSDQPAVQHYIADLTGRSDIAQRTGTATTQAGSFPYYRQGRLVYIPQGMTIPIALTSSISSETAKAGDPIQAQIAETVNLGDTQIPQGSVILGEVTEAVPGARMSHSGHLGMKFTTLRTADGATTPINAHIIGGVGKYNEIGSDVYQGESVKTKAEKAALAGAIGAGAGALLGTAIGAISSHGYNTGGGTVAGTMLGAGVGVAESLMLRKGSNVQVSSGQTLTLQLDAPASISVGSM